MEELSLNDLLKQAFKRKREELVATYTLTREQLLALGVSETAIKGLPEPEFKKGTLNPEEPEEPKVTLDDLPELPFEKILGYLSLQERIKCRAVSRRWCKTIDSFRPKSLCYSEHPSGFIYQKSRWVSGAFAQNFVHSARFNSFCQTFGHSILSSLKHLRLCDLLLEGEHATAFFAQTLSSFGRLEELDIIRFDLCDGPKPKIEFELNLPMLNSIQLEEVYGMNRLTLDAPKLQNVKYLNSSSWLNLDLVHTESVKNLITRYMNYPDVKNWKNLEYLQIFFIGPSEPESFSTFLSDLEQLKEIHLMDPDDVKKLFKQKQRYGLADLKIFLCGCLLSGPNDPAIESLDWYFNTKTVPYLVQHPSKLTVQTPFCTYLNYKGIECVPQGSEITVLNKFTDLNLIEVSSPVQDIERFLDILKSLDIVNLKFECNQAQDLFDRLPDHCAVQKLTIWRPLADFRFLFELSHLIEIVFYFSIDVKLIRDLFAGLKFLLRFEFKCLNKHVTIKTEHHPKQFKVSVWLGPSVPPARTEVSDLDSAIRFIVEKTKE